MERQERWDGARHPRSVAAGAPCFAARLVGAEVWFPFSLLFSSSSPGPGAAG